MLSPAVPGLLWTRAGRVVLMLKGDAAAYSTNIRNATTPAHQQTMGGHGHILRIGVASVVLGVAAYGATDVFGEYSTYNKLRTTALELAEKNEELKAHIGHPFETGPWYDASIGYKDRGFICSCEFQLKGPKAATDINIRAARKPGSLPNGLYNVFGLGIWKLIDCKAMFPVSGGTVRPRSLVPHESVPTTADIMPDAKSDGSTPDCVDCNNKSGGSAERGGKGLFDPHAHVTHSASQSTVSSGNLSSTSSAGDSNPDRKAQVRGGGNWFAMQTGIPTSDPAADSLGLGGWYSRSRDPDPGQPPVGRQGPSPAGRGGSGPPPVNVTFTADSSNRVSHHVSGTDSGVVSGTSSTTSSGSAGRGVLAGDGGSQKARGRSWWGWLTRQKMPEKS